MDLSMEISLMFSRNEIDEQISALNKQATQYSINDLNKAIECLEMVWKLIPQTNTNYGAKGYVRLPNFLQQAGRFNEAKIKFNDLLNMADHYAERMGQSHDLKEYYQPFSKELFLSEIYDAMRIVYKREKLIADADHFKKLSEFHYEESQKYSEQLRIARNKMLEPHRKRHEEMRKKREQQINFSWTPKF